MSEGGGPDAELTMERARVAVSVAALLKAWALQPGGAGPQAVEEPEIELMLGPSRWVTVNRTQMLEPWQPHRPHGR
jgi:hypothetical protein